MVGGVDMINGGLHGYATFMLFCLLLLFTCFMAILISAQFTPLFIFVFHLQ